jgi:hypothetical protein
MPTKNYDPIAHIDTTPRTARYYTFARYVQVAHITADAAGEFILNLRRVDIPELASLGALRTWLRRRRAPDAEVELAETVWYRYRIWKRASERRR